MNWFDGLSEQLDAQPLCMPGTTHPQLSSFDLLCASVALEQDRLTETQIPAARLPVEPIETLSVLERQLLTPSRRKEKQDPQERDRQPQTPIDWETAEISSEDSVCLSTNMQQNDGHESGTKERTSPEIGAEEIDDEQEQSCEQDANPNDLEIVDLTDSPPLRTISATQNTHTRATISSSAVQFYNHSTSLNSSSAPVPHRRTSPRARRHRPPSNIDRQREKVRLKVLRQVQSIAAQLHQSQRRHNHSPGHSGTDKEIENGAS
eukprot:TRINITY_DN1114_c0_g1_i2.p1 TRINITY_DN1114_c0_g1~~TRINITY_DN1114_c0_g1_i2.p1  ORF type:complete len:263 (-),score=63.92 TRINITY_DN1114_c0_g1_i2:1799-2587(-)